VGGRVGLPRLLIVLLRFSGDLTEAYFRGLDFAAIGGPVDWAGPEPASEGTTLPVAIVGEAGREWLAVRTGGTWTPATGMSPPPAATISLDHDTAWRLFTKAGDAATARRLVTIGGDRALAERVFGAVALLA